MYHLYRRYCHSVAKKRSARRNNRFALQSGTYLFYIWNRINQRVEVFGPYTIADHVKSLRIDFTMYSSMPGHDISGKKSAICMALKDVQSWDGSTQPAGGNCHEVLYTD